MHYARVSNENHGINNQFCGQAWFEVAAWRMAVVWKKKTRRHSSPKNLNKS